MTLQRPTQAELDCMSRAEKDALILTLFDGFSDLQHRVGELEGQPKKTSRNSSKPPTSWRVPFDNNAAECLVRPVKGKLKVSGGLRAVGVEPRRSALGLGDQQAQWAESL